ncbi:unnamed protein product [Litomosoides sigmodontis]|uniref:Uncharacterized protein n=1 Tax=Litomosoides sigmodontis TaxID=42156 RepID=A0A3P6TSI2_LITSI|nr:unnamed protein product [Litomosoides sigmodontis]
MEFSIPSGCFCEMFTEDWNISIAAFAEVSRIDQRLCVEQVLTLLKPVLSIKKSPLQNGLIDINAAETEEQFQISIENSLNMLLTGCEIRIDGTGLVFDDSPILCGSIEAHNTLTLTTGAARRTKVVARKIVAVFNCDQLKNVRTYFVSN